jgi:hypothetical protein
MTEAQYGGLAQHSPLSEEGPGVTLLYESPELKVLGTGIRRRGRHLRSPSDKE